MTLGSNAPPIALDNGSSISSKQKSVPRWVPLSLLAFSTVALVAPVLLLRRHKANILSKALEDAPPPPRRTAIAPAHLGAVTTFRVQQPTRPQLPPPTEQSMQPGSAEPVDDFNGALYSMKAFGYATFLVMTGALTTVWGVKSFMGVENTQEFATRMRSLMQSSMPGLMSRLHRAPTHGDDEASAPAEYSGPSDPHVMIDDRTGSTEWSWPDAEKRLTTAFERGGFSGWAHAVMLEVEAESKIERQKRGHA